MKTKRKYFVVKIGDTTYMNEDSSTSMDNLIWYKGIDRSMFVCTYDEKTDLFMTSCTIKSLAGYGAIRPSDCEIINIFEIEEEVEQYEPKQSY